MYTYGFSWAINGPLKREFIGLISFVTGSANFDSAVKILLTVYEEGDYIKHGKNECRWRRRTGEDDIVKCDSLILNLIDNIIVDLYNWLNS